MLCAIFLNLQQEMTQVLIVGEPLNDDEAAVVLSGDDAAKYVDNVVNEEASVNAAGDEQESDEDDVLEEDMAVQNDSCEDEQFVS